MFRTCATFSGKDFKIATAKDLFIYFALLHYIFLTSRSNFQKLIFPNGIQDFNKLLNSYKYIKLSTLILDLAGVYYMFTSWSLL